MNIKISILCFASLFMIQGMEVSHIKTYKLQKILIDPGHGGRDYGCRSYGINEKDIALAISQKLGKKIKNIFPNIEIIYTRTRDVSTGLKERLDMIRKHKPGLAISIHCNASKDKKANGFEVYVRGKEAYWPTFKIKANLDYYSLRAVERENRVILMEENYKEKYKEFDNKSIYSKIAAKNYSNVYFENSIRIGEMMSKHIKTKNIKSRGILRGGFIILARAPTTMVLVELGFLTNYKEAKFLNSENGQSEYVDALFKAIKEYKKQIEC